MKAELGRNMVALKQSNRSQILNILRFLGPTSRKDIAKMMQLTPAAVTILVNEMINEGILKEMGQSLEEDKRVGRKKVLIDINSNYKYVLGINIETELISIGVANLKGEVISSKTIELDYNKTYRETLLEICNECINLLWRNNITKEDVLGVGVGIIGLVDEKEGLSLRAYGLWEEKVPVVKIIEKNIGLKTVLENNVRALALSEIDNSMTDGLNNMLFIKYGPGIGATMIIDGEIYYGSCKTAGELGHTIIDLNGPKCKCGRNGCLESIASYKAILKHIKSVFSSKNTPFLYDMCNGKEEDIDFNKVIQAYILGEKYIIEYLDKTIYYFAAGISNAISLFDPQRIVLYGEAFNNDVFLKKILSSLENLNTNKNIDEIIYISKQNNKTNYIGGVSLALREMFYKVGGIV